MSSIWVKFANWRNGNHGAAYRTRLFVYDEYVPASDLAAARAENERLTKERDEARAQVVGAFEAAASVAWADRESGLTVNTKIRALTPDDAQAALQSMLADAERDMRQRAADSCLGLMTAQSARKFILALPLKHGKSDNG